ncbi:MAG: response regulator transcription factor [Verrucomicrobiota bacterium]
MSKNTGRSRPPKASILVVDDHQIVREGLVRVIDRTADLKVGAQAGNIAQAHAAIGLARPAAVIVDITLGSQNGIELIKDLKVRHPDLPLLVHSIHDETIYAERCLRAGAKGYVMKQENSELLLRALRQILKGEVFVSPAMNSQLLQQLSDNRSGKGTTAAERLSDRELEVFELLGRGHRTKEVACLLHLSDKTIQTHREHIKEKLGIKDAVSLVRRAVQWVESGK